MLHSGAGNLLKTYFLLRKFPSPYRDLTETYRDFIETLIATNPLFDRLPTVT